MTHRRGWVLFDWGDTLMRVFFEYPGPMKDWPRVEILPGALEMLALLAPDWGLALATNAADSDEADIRAALDRVGLDRLLERIYCSRRIGCSKPSADFFRSILDDLSLPPDQVIMVGDDFEADVLGANAAGIRGIWYNTRDKRSRSARLHCTVHDLAELPALLAGWYSTRQAVRLPGLE